MADESKQIALPDGRLLGYARLGIPDGAPVVFAHGFPASRLEAQLWEPAARQAGVSLIAPDRPGFGLSEFQADRGILDWPDDVAALVDALGLDQFWLLGGSAGCPYTLACAHRLGPRVSGVAVVGGPDPTDSEATRGMGSLARGAFALANHAPHVFRTIYGGLAKLVAQRPELNYRLNKTTAPDRKMLARPDIRAQIDASIREAFRSGSAGAVNELLLLARPWGFDIEHVSSPLQIWHGLDDGVTPHTMSELIARRAPDARLPLVAGEGHLSLPIRYGIDILETLVSSG